MYSPFLIVNDVGSADFLLVEIVMSLATDLTDHGSNKRSESVIVNE